MTKTPSGSCAPLTSDEEAFLRAFARASLVIPRVFDSDLLREEQMSLTEYFVLVHLSEAPEHRLRMSDLASESALSLSGMTRVVNRLEGLGLVRRQRSASDGRGWHAVLTEAGVERLARAWPAHLASVRRRLFDHLGGIDLPAITAALQATSAASEPAAMFSTQAAG